MAKDSWSGDHKSVVEPFIKDYPGYIVAGAPPCEDIARLEAGFETRNFRMVPLDQLDSLSLPRCWYLGFLVCPDDDVNRIIRWVAGIAEKYEDYDDRIGIYVHPDVDEDSLVRKWISHGLRPPRIEQLESDSEEYSTFHPLFGNHHANCLHRDVIERHDDL